MRTEKATVIMDVPLTILILYLGSMHTYHLLNIYETDLFSHRLIPEELRNSRRKQGQTRVNITTDKLTCQQLVMSITNFRSFRYNFISRNFQNRRTTVSSQTSQHLLLYKFCLLFCSIMEKNFAIYFSIL